MDFSTLTSGAPIAAVNPQDLRRVWELVQETNATFLQGRAPEAGSPQSSVSINVSVLAQVCEPGANVLAVWARSALLQILVRQGLPASWQGDTQLADTVFDLAATFPLPTFDRFDPDAFLQQLGSRRA